MPTASLTGTTIPCTGIDKYKRKVTGTRPLLKTFVANSNNSEFEVTSIFNCTTATDTKTYNGFTSSLYATAINGPFTFSKVGDRWRTPVDIPVYGKCSV